MRGLSKFLAEKQGTILKVFLSFILALFIGILAVVYFISKQANPIILDEKGKPVNVESSVNN